MPQSTFTNHREYILLTGIDLRHVSHRQHLEHLAYQLIFHILYVNINHKIKYTNVWRKGDDMLKYCDMRLF